MVSGSPISFSGLGSGLDSAAIIKALVQIERVPIELLEDDKELQQKKLSLLGTFKGHVNALRDKSKALAALGDFLSFAVKPSVEGAATFAATGNAVAGAHTIKINSLATADRWAFNAVSNPDTDLATSNGQTVGFTYNGQTYSVSVNIVDSSLNEIAAALKTAVGGKVSVSVVNAGTTAQPSWQLMVAGNDTGKDFRISSISSTVAGLTINGTAPDASGNPLSPNNLIVGNNAVAVIDGMTVTRSKNDFSDVVPGVSIQALKADAATTVTFTVEPDKTKIKAKLQEFVDAYNQVVKFVNDQGAYSEEKGPGGELFGDSALRTIKSVVSNALFKQTSAQVAGDTQGYGTLRLVGIETNTDGTLKVNATVMDKKMNANLDAFADLFVDKDGFDNGGAAPGSSGFYTDITADKGLADTLMREIDRVVKPYQNSSGTFYAGVFDSRTKAIDDKITGIDKQIAEKERRLDIFEAQLKARFTALETLMAQLNQQGQYLGQVFG